MGPVASESESGAEWVWERCWSCERHERSLAPNRLSAERRAASDRLEERLGSRGAQEWNGLAAGASGGEAAGRQAGGRAECDCDSATASDLRACACVQCTRSPHAARRQVSRVVRRGAAAATSPLCAPCRPIDYTRECIGRCSEHMLMRAQWLWRPLLSSTQRPLSRFEWAASQLLCTALSMRSTCWRRRAADATAPLPRAAPSFARRAAACGPYASRRWRDCPVGAGARCIGPFATGVEQCRRRRHCLL